VLKGSQREPAAHKGLLLETLRVSSKKALRVEGLGLKLINPFYLLLVSVPPQPGQQWPGSPLFLSRDHSPLCHSEEGSDEESPIH
jgi:hypothetical protein